MVKTSNIDEKIKKLSKAQADEMYKNMNATFKKGASKKVVPKKKK